MNIRSEPVDDCWPVGLNIRGDARTWAQKLGVKAASSIVKPGFKLKGKRALGPIQVVDLFCGAGGLSFGFELLGRLTPSYEIVGAADLNRSSVSTYHKNLGIEPQIVDLLSASRTRKNLESLRDRLKIQQGRPLIVIGGPPCQGFSAHRKKSGGAGDDRNALIAAFARIAVFLKPQAIVFENVPEVMAEKHWKLFDAMCRIFRDAGYSVSAHIHNLAGFGVPQQRFRTLFLATRRPVLMPEPFYDPHSFRTVRDAIGYLPIIQPGKPNLTDEMHVCARHRTETIETIRKVPRDGGSRPPGVGPRCLQNVDGFRDVYGRLFWDRPANTITAFARNPASGRFIHPSQHRGLSIREAANLQGFPDTYAFAGTFDDKFLQIGNAVPPPFSAYLAAHLLGEFEAEYAAPDSASFGPTSNSFSSGLAGRKRAG